VRKKKKREFPGCALGEPSLSGVQEHIRRQDIDGVCVLGRVASGVGGRVGGGGGGVGVGVVGSAWGLWGWGGGVGASIEIVGGRIKAAVSAWRFVWGGG